ncbi:MAG: hypothetical protein KDK07_03325 [Bauldia sp.]|nr:hypothetical protein [Bauldia sp.]
MKAARPFDLAGKRAVLATMHGKEEVIGPVLEAGLGLSIEVPRPFDTDRFGTFSREVERKGSQLDAARAKLAAGLEASPEASVGIASEGSFGPHPNIPLLAVGKEIVVLHDLDTKLEIVGCHIDLSPNYDHMVVEDIPSALSFAKRVGFPAQGVVVIGIAGGVPIPSRYLTKRIDNEEHLVDSVGEALKACGAAHLETDMRAHRNPTRMLSIKRAAEDLLNRYRRRCPACSRPGLAVGRRVFGLPCAWCGEPTLALKAEIETCAGCGLSLEHPAPSSTAEPGECPQCNP